MTLLVRDAHAGIDVSTAQFAPQITGLVAGEDIDVAAPCYIKSVDGKVYMSNGTSADEAAEIVGFSPRAAKAGQAVTLFGKGARFRYGSSLTPGDLYYIGATAGRLDDTATTGDAVGVAQAITDTDIRIVRDSVAEATTSMIADDAVTKAKLAGGFVKVVLIDGGTAGDHTVTGIETGDELVSVIHNTAGTLADLTSEFSISAADTINNDAGTDTSSDQLLITYLDLT